MRWHPATILLFLAAGTSPLFGQQVQVTTPFQRFGDSFYENMGFNWSYQRMGPGGGFYFNGPGMAAPPFGLGDPNADARGGFMRRGRNSNFAMNFVFGQGSNRTNSVQAPSVMVPNGGTGFISDTIQRPFVTGFVPIVGQQAYPIPPQVTSPVQQALQRLRENPGALAARSEEADTPVVADPRLDAAGHEDPPLRLGTPQSSANRGDLSIAEIEAARTQQEQMAEQEIALLIEKAKGKESAGAVGVAIIYYRQAASRASGPLRDALQSKIASLQQQRDGQR